VHKTKVDYIILGQGLAGSWLAHELIKRNSTVVVINQSTENAASMKAAGLYNPITGRKMIKTWRADDLFESLEKEYEALEDSLNSKFLHKKAIYRPFRNPEDQNDWQGRQGDGEFKDYIEKVYNDSLDIENVQDPYGGILLRNSGYVDIPLMLKSFKKYLINKGTYYEEVFESSKVRFEENHVSYRNWEASKLISCEGPKTLEFWSELPFKLVRGDIMDIQCNLKSEYIINQGVFMIPKNDFITVGSTYDHKVLSYIPQPLGIQALEERLAKIFTGDYRILNRRAGIRPATRDRRPFIGFHKKIKSLAIFNGMGAKGVSLSPYFAKHFVDVLEGKCELDEEVDVQRTY